MAQSNHFVDPRNPQYGQQPNHPLESPHPPHEGQIQYGPQSRTGSMRLDLPPPPIFTTQPAQNVDYPDQYGPPTGGFTYQGAPPISSPLPPHVPHAGSSSHLYAPPDYADSKRAGKPYPGSLPTSPYGDPNQPSMVQQQAGYPTYQQQPDLSPYYTPYGQPLAAVSSNGSNGSNHMIEYFPPYAQATPAQTAVPPIHPRQAQVSPPYASSTWQSPHLVTPATSSRPDPTSATGSSQSGGSANHHGPKTSRQQFTACGACRHRRVKCDLKDRQEEAERKALEDGDQGVGPVRTASSARKKKVICTNCQERGMNCVDEFAPMKAAKQLRRGKRISEIEMLYGKQATSAAAVTTDTRIQAGPSQSSPGVLPELSPDFFESAFFRRFQVQRPVLDPTDFVARYLSFATPCAANLGPEGAILCHVLYAWAVSYGVDEHGRLDVPEGGGTSNQPISLLEPGKDEIKREEDRQVRFRKMQAAVEVVLREIDAVGILRKPTWDGVRVLLLLLPLTEGMSTPAISDSEPPSSELPGISSQVERLAMYESALSQVFMLCSYGAMGYDGKAAGTSSVNGGSDTGDGRDLNIVRIRTYWYAFVHEGITTGLKGGRLLLDGDDLETIQDSISNRTLVTTSSNFRSASRMAVAPINLALACRLINRALTGPTARRRDAVNPDHVKEAWEALEGCWEEFESIRNIAPGQYASQDEIVRFVDGWKIFLFEAQNKIREDLELRLGKLTNAQSSAYISDPVNAASQPDKLESQIRTVAHLLEIAKSKCDFKTRQIMSIVRQHVGTRFFEWDASLVRDGTYYTAMLLAKHHGSDDDIALCVQALNELRWAHAKAWSRSADLRREWSTRSAHSSTEQIMTGWEGAPPSLSMINTVQTNSHPNSHGTNSSLSNSPYTSPSLISPIYDTSNMSINGGAPPPPSMEGYWQTGSGVNSHLAPPPLQQGQYTMPNHDQSMMPPPSDQYTQQQQPQMVGYGNMGYCPPPPPPPGPPHQEAGRYVFQPDGTQVYVPYNQEQ